MSDYWKRKLLAYLHDPPEKAYSYGPTHRERAQRYLERVLGPGRWADHQPDWMAAAADRFIFPDGQKLHQLGLTGLGGGVRFIHPLTGRLAFATTDFPREEDAADIISEVLPSFGESRDQVRADASLQFWLLWRAWLHFSVTHHAGRRQGADKLAYLPADTRVPDGTIWHHNAIVSAIEAARDAQGDFAPAFLLFQIGPVQDFIGQARSTRDSWSGSYLLSWMIAHTVQRITEEYGPDCIVYPSLRGQPLHDWLNRSKLEAAGYGGNGSGRSQSFWESLDLNNSQDLVLTPNLPNRFLAIVPADFNPERQLAGVFDYGPDSCDADEKSEWRRICDACWDYLNSRAQLCPSGQENVKLRLWRFQCRNFWQVSWQLWRWQDAPAALDWFKSIPLGTESPLHLGHEIAWAIPDSHKDERNYREGRLNPGSAWSAHYQLLSHRLDARRQTRNFTAWCGEAGAHKDALSGKEDVIADREWLQRARKNSALRHLFRKNDEMGAPNLIKRVWHKAYLEKLSNLTRARESFDSVPAVAARPFAEWLREHTGSGPLREPFVIFMDAAAAAREDFPDTIARWENDENAWCRYTDASAFHLGEWDRAIEDAENDDARKRLAAARDRLARLLEKCGTRPSKYYAVLALDGDHIGKWLSGEKTPAIKDVITSAAADYFGQHVSNSDVKAWLNSPRPLSPCYHLQFSEALANFGLYCAGRIVEAHHGQLIYSGGDDVLAMLPADEAIACAQGLRLAFQGKSTELIKHAEGRYAHLFHDGVPEGFIRLKDGDPNRGCRRVAEPSWPLLVPGPRATVSVGLAIGHMKEPLQDMIREAQSAEKRAKADPEREIWDEHAKCKKWRLNEGWGRDALAVTLFKRSGETIQWGAKFDSPAFAVLEHLRQFYRAPLDAPEKVMPISGKFPYRIAELLSRYEVDKPLTEDALLRDIVAKELSWVIHQQAWKDKRAEEAGSAFRRVPLESACLAYLDHLRDFTWDRPRPESGKEPVQAARPLREFINLFALEAFISRRGD
jgi:CRISPR-associated protein Cmr2